MELCDKYLHECIKIAPSMNDFLKYKKYKHLRHIQKNFFKEDYDKKFNKLFTKYLDLINRKKHLTFYDKILKRGLTYSKRIDRIKFTEFLPLSSLDNFYYNIPSLIQGDMYFNIKTKKDIDDLINRFKIIPDMTETVITRMRKGIQKGITMYKGNLDILIENLQNILKSRSYVFKKNITYKKKFNEIIEKYYVGSVKKLLLFLLSEYYPCASNKLGFCQYPGGKELYKILLKESTFDNATPDNVHKLGLLELKRLIKYRNKFYGKDIKKYKKNNFEYVKKDKVLKILHNYREELYKNMEKYFHDNLDKKNNYLIKTSPPEIDGMSAYYYPTDFNKQKKGTFYINLNKIDFDINEMAVLSVHEGMPGHHYQLEKLLNDDTKPDYIKYFGETAYCEGWALYTENLFNYNHKELFHKINYEILRSLRLIVDTGIHYYGWCYEKSFNFMNKYLDDKDLCRKEILRYISSPCQAVTYKIGEKTILHLRNIFLKKYPDKLKDFHEIILDMGPCPLDLLINNFKNKILSIINDI